MSSDHSPGRLVRAASDPRLHAAFLLLIGASLLGSSWLRWPDVLIDYGSQLYIPWQISEGKRLYADLVYGYGPLAPYLSALYFRVFGVGLQTLVWTNVAVTAAVTFLLHRLLSRFTTPLVSLVCCVAFLVLFALSHPMQVGNYNFITPYETNITYGLLLSLLAMECLGRHFSAPGRATLLLSGLLLGLVSLTKLEIFVALAFAMAVGLGGHLQFLLPRLERPLRSIADASCLFAAAFLLPVLVCIAALGTRMPWRDALAGTLGSALGVLRSGAPDLDFYRVNMGTHDVMGSLAAMGASLGGQTLVVLAACALSLAAPAPSRRRDRAMLGFIVFLIAAAALWTFRTTVDWPGLARPLPLVAGWVLGRALLRIRGAARADASISPERELSLAVFAAFALACMLKMILYVRINHYGFVLAMPAAMLAIVVLLDWIPRALQRRGHSSGLYLAVISAFVAVHLGVTLEYTRHWLSRKTVPVGKGADRFLADDRGELVNATLAAIEDLVQPGESLFAMPEGVMLNYLARRTNSTPYTILMPTGIEVRGEEEILASLRRKPPDWVVLVHKDTSEFGYRYFGTDYARRIGNWVRAGYQPLRLVGSPPLRSDRFGILLLRKRVDPAPPAGD